MGNGAAIPPSLNITGAPPLVNSNTTTLNTTADATVPATNATVAGPATTNATVAGPATTNVTGDNSTASPSPSPSPSIQSLPLDFPYEFARQNANYTTFSDFDSMNATLFTETAVSQAMGHLCCCP